MHGSVACLSIGSTLVKKDYFDGFGWLCAVAEKVGMTAANIIIFDAPRALRAEKVRISVSHEWMTEMEWAR